MRLLLDTHVVLWWLGDDPQLGSAARAVIADPDNFASVSAVSLWEIAVKHALGKLTLPANWREALAGESFQRLPVTWEHAWRVGELPDYHRDPFDRLLIAQALVEDLQLVTRDRAFARYGVSCFQA